MATQTSTDYILPNKVYDLLKKTTTIVLPGLGSLYLALAQIWGLPAAEQVTGTIVAVNLFLGLLLAFGSSSYNNSEDKYAGTLDVTPHPDGTPRAVFALNDDPTEVPLGKEVVFKVGKVES